jgi:hypothetical protein
MFFVKVRVLLATFSQDSRPFQIFKGGGPEVHACCLQGKMANSFMKSSPKGAA